MEEGNNHIKIYSAEEIQSYLEGRMSPAEMHALEIAALEDPFLADAIDGYQQSGVSAGSSNLELKQALEDRLTRSRSNRMIPGWLKIAAAVAVLVTTVVSITLIINPWAQHEAIVASKKERHQKLEDTGAIVASGVGNQEPQNKAELRKETQNPGSSAPQQLKSVPKVKESSLPGSNPEVRAEDPGTDMAMPSAAAAETPISSQLRGSVSGVVIDSNKRPVPGATVTVAKQQVVTDDSGLFALKPTDTVMNVEIQSVGFATRNAIVKDDAVLDTIVLRPSSASLEEVVVTGFGTKKNARAANRESGSGPIAYPSIPWEEYQQYLKKQLQSSGIDTLPGEAVISFTASPEGRLSKFKVEKSAPTKAVNALLIDLIKSGPRWQVDGGKAGRGTVRIPLGLGIEH